jgi:hypothetical protein
MAYLSGNPLFPNSISPMYQTSLDEGWRDSSGLGAGWRTPHLGGVPLVSYSPAADGNVPYMASQIFVQRFIERHGLHRTVPGAKGRDLSIIPYFRLEKRHLNSIRELRFAR